MPTHSELRTRARLMGHKLTPELDAELLMLSAVTDEEIRTEARKWVVRKMAREFQVPVPAMDRRIPESFNPLEKDNE